MSSHATYFRTVYACGHVHSQCRCMSPAKETRTLAERCPSCVRGKTGPIEEKRPGRGRGFGSPLRRALRESRAQENAVLAGALTAEQRAELPLRLKPNLVGEVFGPPVSVPVGSDRITLTIPPPVLLFASAVLPEDRPVFTTAIRWDPAPDLEDDGWSTVYSTPSRA